MPFFKTMFQKFLVWLGGDVPDQPVSEPLPHGLTFNPVSGSKSAAPIAPAAPPVQRITVRDGDTLFSLANQFNISVQTIMQANRLPQAKIYVGQKLTIPQANQARAQQQVYRINPGDTLAGIAQTFGRTASAIATENKLTDLDHLSPGQWLIIPALTAAPEASLSIPLPPPATDSEFAAIKAAKRRPDQQHSPQSAQKTAVKARQGSFDLNDAEVNKPAAKPKSTPQPPPGKAQSTATPKPVPPTERKPASAPRPAPSPPKPAPKPAQSKPAKPAIQSQPVPKPGFDSESPTRPVVPIRPQLPTQSKKPEMSPSSLSKPPEPPQQTQQFTDKPTPQPTEKKIDEALTPKVAPKQPTPQALIASERPIQVRIPARAGQGIYLASHTLGNRQEQARMMRFIEESPINTVVIDIKNDWGYLSYRSQVSLAAQIEAGRPIIIDLPSILETLHERQVHTIGRLVTFKDNLLARHFPELAAKRPNSGEIWRDDAGMAWVDPFQQTVWDYNIALAQEASQLGFQEIQFTDARFPHAGQSGAMIFSQPLTGEARKAAISGFMSVARGALAASNTKMAATIIGYACWRQDDSLVGQDIERLAGYLDVLSPLLYPSAFGNGIPGCPQPLDCPAEISGQSTSQVVKRVKASAPTCEVRPWIQDFPDYAFDHRKMNINLVRSQINGVIQAGATGYLAWNPQSHYTQNAY